MARNQAIQARPESIMKSYTYTHLQVLNPALTKAPAVCRRRLIVHPIIPIPGPEYINKTRLITVKGARNPRLYNPQTALRGNT